MLDTTRTVETPEGVELALHVAGPAPRLLAWGIDTAIRLAGYAALAMPLSLLGQAGSGVLLVVLFLGEWLYPVFFEARSGATPGKRQLGLLVLHDDGTPVGWGAASVRNLVRFADFLPLAYGFGIVTMTLNRDFKRLGDLAAGTVVVHREPAARGLRVPAASPEPPPQRLGREEQRAIVDFAERLPTWTDSRAQELAALARPLTGSDGPAAVRRLVAYANWLVGRR